MIYDFKSIDGGWNSDILIVKKHGKDITIDEVKEDTPWAICDYNHNTEEYELFSLLDLTDWSDNVAYDGGEFTIIASMIDKIKYAFASLYNDNYVEGVVKEIFPHITDVKIPAQRYTRKYYLKYWMEKYKFSLKDFIINDKYTVLSCTGCGREFYDLDANGLIDWDEIEYCSEDVEDGDE